MFERAAQDYVDLTKYSIIHLFESTNEPLISLSAGKATARARAFVLAAQSRPNSLEVFIGLYFPESRERVLSVSEPFAPERVREQIGEAEAYLGQMGFIIESVDYENASRDQRKEIMHGIPFLYEDLTHFLQSKVEETRLGIQKKAVESSSNLGEAQVDSTSAFLEQYLRIASML